MCLAQGPQRGDAGEAQTRSPSVLSQALYHCSGPLYIKMIKGVMQVITFKNIVFFV